MEILHLPPSPAFKFTPRHPSKPLDRKFLQRGAFVGARTVHTTWQQSINQSPNRAVKRHSTDTLNLTARTAANHSRGEKKNKNQNIFPVRRCFAHLCSSLRQTPVGVREKVTRQHDRRCYLRCCEERSAVDYHTHRHLFGGCVNRPASVGFSYQRQIDERAQRWLSLSFEANGDRNINLLKGCCRGGGGGRRTPLCPICFEWIWRGKVSGRHQYVCAWRQNPNWHLIPRQLYQITPLGSLFIISRRAKRNIFHAKSKRSYRVRAPI